MASIIYKFCMLAVVVLGLSLSQTFSLTCYHKLQYTDEVQEACANNETIIGPPDQFNLSVAYRPACYKETITGNGTTIILKGCVNWGAAMTCGPTITTDSGTTGQACYCDTDYCNAASKTRGGGTALVMGLAAFGLYQAL
ncbi:uncharacterized protein LOC129589611 [Paramacrobiotus metropolitanus]|uniref:uncharacterized protein LOC129589611 n=1 Tax=Paramacrobiotus metropolitanus TaxID=2943436 RepID=UPI002445852A|nr:uncharacterized protein LOC129589611 [Paramacrobiotus metropolitanus]